MHKRGLRNVSYEIYLSDVLFFIMIGLIVPLPKYEGNRVQYMNYWTIDLVSHPSMMLLRVPMKREYYLEQNGYYRMRKLGLEWLTNSLG